MGSGPLAGIRVVELAGIGPAPFCAMLLADLGADVVRVDRKGTGLPPGTPDPRRAMSRGRRSIAVDLKRPEGIELVLRLVAASDALIEGFRPGVMERLGLGPDLCLARNPALVYGRMTGWGQQGPLANAAGHDINYIAIAGALEPLGRAGERPVAPLNLVGDFGGGGMMLAFGIAAALLEARTSGQGQVVDAAMVDGAALLMSMIHDMHGMGIWRDDRGHNFLDTGSHFYDTYETQDGKFIALGPVEAEFYAEFLERVGLADAGLPHQLDEAAWPDMKRRFAELFLSRTRDEWCELLEGTDACFSPALSLTEAPTHPHNVARNTFIEVDGMTQPAPAPRFSRTPAGTPGPLPVTGEHADEVMADVGYDLADVDKLRELGVIE